MFLPSCAISSIANTTKFKRLVSIYFLTCPYYHCMHYLLHSFTRTESISTSSLLQWSKDMILTSKKVWQVCKMKETLKTNVLDHISSQTGSMWCNVVMLQQNSIIHLIYVFICFLHWWLGLHHPQHMTCLSWNLENHSRTLCSSHSLLSKNYF
jgi:hypothetical protein